MKTYYVYILASESGTLYVGVTNDLEGRVRQHKLRSVEGFTKKYWVTKLLYYEEHESAVAAIEREKQIKRWRRDKKVKMIRQLNPGWVDLAADWLG